MKHTRLAALITTLVLLLSLGAFAPAHAAAEPFAPISAELYHNGAGVLLTFSQAVDYITLDTTLLSIYSLRVGDDGHTYAYHYDITGTELRPSNNQLVIYVAPYIVNEYVSVISKAGAIKNTAGAPNAVSQVFTPALPRVGELSLLETAIDTTGTKARLTFDAEIDPTSLDTSGAQFSAVFGNVFTVNTDEIYTVVQSARLSDAKTVELTLKYPVPARCDLILNYNNPNYTFAPAKAGPIRAKSGNVFWGRAPGSASTSNLIHIAAGDNSSTVSGSFVNGQRVAAATLNGGVLTLTPTAAEWTAIMAAAFEFADTASALPYHGKALYVSRTFSGATNNDKGLTLSLTPAQLADLTDMPVVGDAFMATLYYALTQPPSLSTGGNDRVELVLTNWSHSSLKIAIALTRNGSPVPVASNMPLAYVNFTELAYAAHSTVPTYCNTRQPIMRSFNQNGFFARVCALGEYTMSNGVSSSNFIDEGDASWATGSIRFLQARGVVGGTGGGKFSPNRKVTRAEFVTMLMRTVTRNVTTTGVKQFADVPAGSYYEQTVLKARALGLVGGTGGNKFNPTAYITRQDIATMLLRLMNLDIYMYLYDADVKAVNAFSDYNTTADYAKNAIDVMVQNKIMGGSAGKLTPTAFATRAETAAMIERMLRF